MTASGDQPSEKGHGGAGIPRRRRRLRAQGQRRLDLALVMSDQECTAAGVFTTNRVKAAPVLFDQQLLSRSRERIRAVVANSGCANACTGELGLADARATAQPPARHSDANRTRCSSCPPASSARGWTFRVSARDPRGGQELTPEGGRCGPAPS